MKNKKEIERRLDGLEEEMLSPSVYVYWANKEDQFLSEEEWDAKFEAMKLENPLATVFIRVIREQNRPFQD